MNVRLALVAALAITLAGCSILPNRQPANIYMLPSALAKSAQPDPQASPLALRVLRPTTGTQTSGRRIVVVPDDGLVSVYAGSAWADPSPILMRDRIVDAMRADGRIARVSADSRNLHADFELDSDLRAFQSEYYNGVPHAVIRLDVRLVSADSRRILASRSFEVRKAANSTDVSDVVQAFGSAADRIGIEVANWVASRPAPQK